jgi:hypothetical protein
LNIYPYICIRKLTTKKKDMKNIICIDLTSFNNEKLTDIANLYNLNVQNLVNDKKQGFAKMYIDTTNGVLVAFTYKKNKDEIVIADVFTDLLKSVTPIILEKKQPKIEMTVDNILDKISKYGIESISINEKNFLDGK